MTRGGLIGVPNAPSVFGASGLWQIPEHFKARELGDWPYVAGGYSLGQSAFAPIGREVWRISDTADTATITARGPFFTISFTTQGACFNSAFDGYMIRASEFMDTMSFASDTFTIGAAGSGFPNVERYNAGSCQSLVDGYAFGGRAGGIFGDSYKWEFSTGVRTLVGSLPITTHGNGGSNSATNGYSFGGTGTGSVQRNQILALSFSAGTWSTLAATISDAGPIGNNRLAASTTDVYLQYERFPNFFRDKFDFATESITSQTVLATWGAGIYSSPSRAGLRTSVTLTSTTLAFFDFLTESITGSITYSAPNQASTTQTGLIEGGWFAAI